VGFATISQVGSSPDCPSVQVVKEQATRNSGETWDVILILTSTKRSIARLHWVAPQHNIVSSLSNRSCLRITGKANYCASRAKSEPPPPLTWRCRRPSRSVAENPLLPL